MKEVQVKELPYNGPKFATNLTLLASIIKNFQDKNYIVCFLKYKLLGDIMYMKGLFKRLSFNHVDMIFSFLGVEFGYVYAPYCKVWKFDLSLI